MFYEPNLRKVKPLVSGPCFCKQPLTHAPVSMDSLAQQQQRHENRGGLAENGISGNGGAIEGKGMNMIKKHNIFV